MTKPILLVGNWKMFGTAASLPEVERIARAADALPANIDLVLCPPATLIERAARTAAGTRLAIGGQNVHEHPEGAHTGWLSAAMLHDAGASVVIVGHSERRARAFEADAHVRAKAVAAIAAGLTPIICVGETETERDIGDALTVVAEQLAGSLPDHGAFVVAYEPVWAIGTGRTPTRAQVAEIHALIRAHAGSSVRILYGGSVKPDNAGALLGIANVDGALVGGASLTATSFLAIAHAAAELR